MMRRGNVQARPPHRQPSLTHRSPPATRSWARAQERAPDRLQACRESCGVHPFLGESPGTGTRGAAAVWWGPSVSGARPASRVSGRGRAYRCRGASDLAGVGVALAPGVSQPEIVAQDNFRRVDRPGEVFGRSA